MTKINTSLSKFISLVLRHKPETIGLELDKNGWAVVSELIEKINSHNSKLISLNEGGFTFHDLKFIVDNNDKKRFIFSEDFTKIRANQGHSIDVDLELKSIQPPQYLYHGTAETNKDSILKNGINKGKRQHVHLSTDINTAIKVGGRHGKPITFRISSKEMFVNGIKFFKSENDVWLTDFIDPKYIKFII
jgi:putative RNA 2'-phosphotransferase